MESIEKPLFFISLLDLCIVLLFQNAPVKTSLRGVGSLGLNEPETFHPQIRLEPYPTGINHLLFFLFLSSISLPRIAVFFFRSISALCALITAVILPPATFYLPYGGDHDFHPNTQRKCGLNVRLIKSFQFADKINLQSFLNLFHHLIYI